jgi:hypothetical protein
MRPPFQIRHGTEGSGRVKVFLQEVEIRFVPKAWAWPELGQTAKWTFGDFSRIVETATLLLLWA